MSDLHYGDSLILTWNSLLVSTETWRCSHCQQLCSFANKDCAYCFKPNPSLKYAKTKIEGGAEEKTAYGDGMMFMWRCDRCKQVNEVSANEKCCRTCGKGLPVGLTPMLKAEITAIKNARKVMSPQWPVQPATRSPTFATSPFHASAPSGSITQLRTITPTGSLAPSDANVPVPVPNKLTYVRVHVPEET